MMDHMVAPHLVDTVHSCINNLHQNSSVHRPWHTRVRKL